MKILSALAMTALLFVASPAKADVMVHDPESYETAIGMKVGAALMGRVNQDHIRIALGVVLILSGFFTVQKGDPIVWPIAAVVAGLGFGLILMAPRWFEHFRPKPPSGPPADDTA